MPTQNTGLPQELLNLALDIEDGVTDPIAAADQRGDLGEIYRYAKTRKDPDSAKFLSEQNLSREELNDVARINLLGGRAPVVQAGREAGQAVRKESEILPDFGLGPIAEGLEQFAYSAAGTGARAMQLRNEAVAASQEYQQIQQLRKAQPVGPLTPQEYREPIPAQDAADEWGAVADRLHARAGNVAEYSNRQGFMADVGRGIGGSVPYLGLAAAGGAPAMIAGAALTSASEKFAETGSVPQALVAGSIEGVVSGAFSAAGLGGLENTFTKGLRRGFMEAGKQTLGEVGEEETIFVLQTIADMVASGQNLEDVDWGQLGYQAAVTATAAAIPTGTIETGKAIFGRRAATDTDTDVPPAATLAGVEPEPAPPSEVTRRRQIDVDNAVFLQSLSENSPGIASSETGPFGEFVSSEQEWETEYLQSLTSEPPSPPDMYQVVDPTPSGNASIKSFSGTNISPTEIPFTRFLDPPDLDAKHEPTIYLSNRVEYMPETTAGRASQFSPDGRSVVVGETQSDLLFHVGLNGKFAEDEGMIRAHQSEQGQGGTIISSMPRVTLESNAKAAKQQADNLRLGIQFMNTGPQGVTSLTEDFLLDSLDRDGKLDSEALDVVQQVTSNIQDLAMQRFVAVEEILSSLSETDLQAVKSNPEAAKRLLGNAILDMDVPPADLRRLLSTNDRSVRLNYIAMDTAMDAINHVHGLLGIDRRVSIPDGADQLRGRKVSEVSILPVRPQNLPQSALSTVNDRGQVRVFADVPTGKNSLVQARRQQAPTVGQRPGDVAPGELLYPKELRVKTDKGTSITAQQQVGTHRIEGTNRMGMGLETGARPRKSDPVWIVKSQTGARVGGRPTDYYTAMKKAQAYERVYQAERSRYQMEEWQPTPPPPEFGPLEPAAPAPVEPAPEMLGLEPEQPTVAPSPTAPAVEFEPGVAEQGPRPMPAEVPLSPEVFEPLGGSPVDLAPKVETLPPSVSPRVANLMPQYMELYAADPDAASEKLWFQMQEDSEGGVDSADFERVDTMLRNAVAGAREAALIAPEAGASRVIADPEEAAVVADDLKAQVETMIEAGIPVDQAVEAAAKAEGVSSAQAGQLLGPGSNAPAITIKPEAAPAVASQTVDPVKDGLKKARDKYFRKHAEYLQNEDAVSTQEEIQDRLAIKKAFRETYGDTATEAAWKDFMRTGATPEKVGKGAGKKVTRRAEAMPHGMTPTQLMSGESRTVPIKKASPEELVYLDFRPIIGNVEDRGGDPKAVGARIQEMIEGAVHRGEWAPYAQLLEWTNGMSNGGRIMNNIHAAMNERGVAIPTNPLAKHDLPPDAVMPWAVNDPKERGAYDRENKKHQKAAARELEFFKSVDITNPVIASMTDKQWNAYVLAVTKAMARGGATPTPEEFLSQYGKKVVKQDLTTETQRIDQVSDTSTRTDIAAPEPELKLTISASVFNESNDFLNKLNTLAAEGDERSQLALQHIAGAMLAERLRGIPSVRITNKKTVGLYGGYFEGSVRAIITGHESDRAAILAGLANFAEVFKQEEVHVRQGTDAPAGTQYSDGSYVSPVYTVTMDDSIQRNELEEMIRQSGLKGVTIEGKSVSTYWTPQKWQGDLSYGEWKIAVKRFTGLALGRGRASVSERAARVWLYGNTSDAGRTPYSNIRGDVYWPSRKGLEAVNIIAEYYKNSAIPVIRQAPKLTPEQIAKQTAIAEDFEAMPMNDLDNPNGLAKKAYEELAEEVRQQYAMLPVTVEFFPRDPNTGEFINPYKNSNDVYDDINRQNHLYIYPTTLDTFGPPGAFDAQNHPLLKPSPFKDANGEPMNHNDLLRAVHDFFAHGMTNASFGPLGEEAAWLAHMSMTKSPWARWALTTETRGQNSYVNFGPNAAHNRAKPLETIFAPQKAALLPSWIAKTGDAHLDAQIDQISSLENPPESGDTAAKRRETQRIEQVSDAWISETLNSVPEGAPGISVETAGGGLNSEGLLIPPQQLVVFRDSKGKVVTVAKLKDTEDGGLAVDAFVTDKTRGITGAKGAALVGEELVKIGATQATGMVSNDAQRFIEKMSSKYAQPAPEESMVERRRRQPPPATADTGMVDNINALLEGVQGYSSEAYEQMKPMLRSIYESVGDAVSFVQRAVAQFGEKIRAYAVRAVAEYRDLGNRGAAINPAAVLAETKRRRDVARNKFFGSKPGQTVAHWLATGGNLNADGAKSLRRNKAWLVSMEKRTTLTNAEFNQIIEESYGTPENIPAAHVKQINGYLNGDASMATFGVLKENTKLLDNLTRMRREVDELSQVFIDEGLVDGSLAAVFGDNIGVYLRRSYRIHSDPNWVEYLKAQQPQVFNALRAEIEDMHDTTRVPFMKRNELLALAHLHYIKNPTGDSLANMSNADLVRALMAVTDTDISKRADDMTHDILLKQQEAGAGTLPMSNVVKGDTSIFMRRKLGDSKYHLALRAAMGEYDGTAIGDIALNYTNSVLRMSKTISAYRFLSDFKDIGLDPNAKFLWLPEEPGRAQAGATKQIVAENNRALAPLDGVYTTPEVYNQLMDAIGAKPGIMDAIAKKGYGANWVVGAYRALQFTNGIAKMGKTVGNPSTQMINMLGALWVQVEHGNTFSIKDTPDVYKMLRSWDKVQRGRGDAAAFRKKHAAAFERWTRKRLLDENPDVNEAMYQLLEFTDHTTMGKKLSGLYDKMRKAIKEQSKAADKAIDRPLAVLQEIQDHYQRVDTTGRILFFEAELEKYRKALHGDTPLDKLSEADRKFIEDKAEHIASKVYINYNDVPRFVHEWRKQPFVGPFITFAFQRIRTTMNSANLILDELTDPNVEVQKIGRRRAAGFAISQFLVTPTLASMSRMLVPQLVAAMSGGDDEEEQPMPGLDGSKHRHTWTDDHMLRRFLPDWLQNSQLFWAGVDRPEGAMGPVYHVGDLSRFDPSGQMKQAMTAVTQGGAAGKGALDIVLSAALEVLDPFIQPGLVGQTTWNLAVGRSAIDFEGIKRGGFNTDVALEQANKVLYEIYELLKPGAVQYAERGWKGAFYEPASPYGRRLDPMNELYSMVSGMRSYPVDLGVNLKQQGGTYKRRTSDIVYEEYTQKVAYTGSESVGSPDAIAKVNEKMAREWEELRTSVRYATKLGMTRNEIERSLKDAGLSETDRSLLWRDREFPGWAPSDQRKKSSGGSSRRRVRL